MILSNKAVIEVRAGVNKKLPENCNIPNYNAIIHIILNLSTYSCLFWENISDYYEFKPKGGPRTNSWSE